ncbi:uncharacterized protein N7503_008126 [Penicillium pulvis]|uniref:uncharacterized protein n=1 Tax=Penicillium pulvis TaxID=1562058 RepID=UPI002548AC24|nr:uncharacterized protein N7503_008126 [Penicillium pulvis]KAJ5792148.1 hypothetical protein N7503_008126 [Penicillium pulvis]
MQYRLVALFAMTVTAVPVILTGGSNAILPRWEEYLTNNVGIAANALSNEDSTSSQNAKREENGLIADYTQLAEDYVNAVKRSDEDLIGNLGVSANALSNGGSTGVQNAKRADDVSVGPVGVGLPGVDVGNIVKRAEDVEIGLIEIRR